MFLLPALSKARAQGAPKLTLEAPGRLEQLSQGRKEMRQMEWLLFASSWPHPLPVSLSASVLVQELKMGGWEQALGVGGWDPVLPAGLGL